MHLFYIYFSQLFYYLNKRYLIDLSAYIIVATTELSWTIEMNHHYITLLDNLL